MIKILRYFGLCKLSELEKAQRINAKLLSSLEAVVRGDINEQLKWEYEFDCFDVINFGDVDYKDGINITAP